MYFNKYIKYKSKYKNLNDIQKGGSKVSDTTKCIQIYTSSKIKNIHININI